MDNSIYEVERDDYVGFVNQLNKEMMNVETYHRDDLIFIKVKSKKTNTHLCTRIIAKEGEEHYFVFKMPEDDERIAPKPILQITLDDREDVQNVVNALNKMQAEAHKDG